MGAQFRFHIDVFDPNDARLSISKNRAGHRTRLVIGFQGNLDVIVKGPGFCLTCLSKFDATIFDRNRC